MDKFLVTKIASKAKRQAKLRDKVHSTQVKRDKWKVRLLDLTKKVKYSSMPDDERAVLQREILSISAALDRTALLAGSRYRERCPITGWARGLKFGVRRNVLRHYASFGQVSGLVKV